MTDDTEQLRAVGYIRVSTDRQAEHGQGLAVQRRSIERWSADAGAVLLAIISDEGVSGSTEAVERPGLSTALQLVAGGEATALVVPKLDRLARSLSVQEACLAQVWSWDAKVFACDLGEIKADDPSDPMRTALRQMVAVFAQLERAMIGVRMSEGRRRKAELGGYAYGAPPLGQRVSEGRLVIDPDEDQSLKRITELHGEGRSLRAIADILTVEGRRTKRGGAWHPQTVKRALRSSE